MVKEIMNKKRLKKIIAGLILIILIIIFFPYWISLYSRLLANYFVNKNNFPKAMKIIEYQVKLDKKLFGTESRQAVEAQEQLADYYLSYGDVKNALNYYINSLKIRQQRGYTVGFYYSYALSNIATCYLDIYDFDKAEYYYKQALDIDQKQHHKNQMIADIINLTNLYINTNRVDKAKEQINSLDGILQESGIQKNSLYSLIIYTKIKYYEKANKFHLAQNLTSNILSDENSLSQRDKIMFMSELANIHLLQGDFNASEKILNQLIIQNNKSPNYEKAKLYRQNALLKIKTNNRKEAEKYLKKSLWLKSGRAYDYSHEVACDYNYLLMINPKNKEYIKYFTNYINYVRKSNIFFIKDVQIYLNTACNY